MMSMCVDIEASEKPVFSFFSPRKKPATPRLAFAKTARASTTFASEGREPQAAQRDIQRMDELVVFLSAGNGGKLTNKQRTLRGQPDDYAFMFIQI